MSINLEDKNKKNASNYVSWFLVLLSLAILCGVCYKRGIDTVRAEAVYLGYAEGGEKFAWKSKRLIGLGE